LARQKGLIFEQRLKGNVPEIVNTDPTRLKQILTNIIGNAVKFTESGRIDVTLEQIQSKGRKFLQIGIRDTGIGLSPEQQGKIFEPFIQADPSVTRKYGGTGLGLVLSRRLARLLGGDLVLAESALGIGSLFVLTIELGEINPSTHPSLESKRVGSLPDSSASLKGCHILVVDDFSDNQTIIRLFIGGAGAIVEIAHNGVEAIEKMRAKTYDAVLMDIQMPMMDGYQALKVAREFDYGGPIIALTAHAMKEEKDRCLAAGFTGYISKPIDRALLIKKLNEVILSSP
jgi:CheY-like chemotaxis protein